MLILTYFDSFAITYPKSNIQNGIIFHDMALKGPLYVCL